MKTDKSKIKLIFVIFGDLLNPQDFTHLIDIKPTAFWKIGDKIQSRNDLFRKESAWQYEIGFTESLFFQDISTLFISIFENKIKLIEKYIKLNSLEVKFYIVCEMGNYETPALFFDRLFLNIVNILNAEIDIDLYK